MTMASLLRVAWTKGWEHALAVAAALVLYSGIDQILSAMCRPLAGFVISGINAIIRRGFRDAVPLPNYYTGVPWQYHARLVGVGVIVLIAGLLLGLWATARGKRQLRS